MKASEIEPGVRYAVTGSAVRRACRDRQPGLYASLRGAESMGGKPLFPCTVRETGVAYRSGHAGVRVELETRGGKPAALLVVHPSALVSTWAWFQQAGDAHAVEGMLRLADLQEQQAKEIRGRLLGDPDEELRRLT